MRFFIVVWDFFMSWVRKGTLRIMKPTLRRFGGRGGDQTEEKREESLLHPRADHPAAGGRPRLGFALLPLGAQGGVHTWMLSSLTASRSHLKRDFLFATARRRRVERIVAAAGH